ncbi:hypothetical protein QT971_21505 [Microcoleus sp. herbarium19]|uniref:hypothetical protein n=1 Tax=unclassified Microcoleus TaxID=2642155 RepID=UPI002FD33C57
MALSGGRTNTSIGDRFLTGRSGRQQTLSVHLSPVSEPATEFDRRRCSGDRSFNFLAILQVSRKAGS